MAGLNLNCNLITPRIFSRVIVAQGDSHTWAGYYEDQLLSDLGGAPWSILEYGVIGRSTVGMLAAFQTEVIDNHPGYVIIWGGGNDYPGTDSTGNLAAMFAAAKAAGIKTICSSVTPRPCSDEQKAQITGINTWLRASPANLDWYIESFTEVEDPTNPWNLLPTYDSGDHVHLSVAGYHVIGSLIYNSVSEFSG